MTQTNSDTALRDARLAILAAAEKFRAASRSSVEADQAFCLAYNTGTIALDSWIYDRVRRVSPRTLRRWWEAIKAGEPMRLTASSRLNRQGTARLLLAEQGAVEKYITALLIQQPYLTADKIRLMVAVEFGEALSVIRAGGRVETVALPGLRAFNRFLAGLRERNRHLLLARTDPDRYKSSVRIAGLSRDQVTRLNPLWEIDASPADVLTKDGRHSLYVLIDVYSRRILTLITKTPRAEAALLLIRREFSPGVYPSGYGPTRAPTLRPCGFGAPLPGSASSMICVRRSRRSRRASLSARSAPSSMI